jgi:uncharacterized membrane protein
MRALRRLLLIGSLLAMVVAPVLALAGPRSGGSFSGRGGFRSGGGSFSRSPSARVPRGYGYGGGGGGHSFFFFPGFGWGSPYGMGGGCGFGGSFMMLVLLGIGVAMAVRAVRQAQRGASGRSFMYGGGADQDDEEDVAPSRAFVYKVQLGLGRSARGIQERLAQFAAEGDTGSEAGLAHLLHQTALELLREKESIRYGSAEASGPFSLSNGESKLNALALAERSRFQVERVRGADGSVRRSSAAGSTSAEVLEYLVVTVLVATRVTLGGIKKLTDREELDAILADLGSVPPRGILGLEVIWTPADPEDALTESDMLLTYPHLRGF